MIDECAVNGETVPHGDTAELVFSAAHLVSYVSRFTQLSAGDINLSGAPGGVGMGMPPPPYLREGDVVTTRIEGIGELQNSIRIPQRVAPELTCARLRRSLHTGRERSQIARCGSRRGTRLHHRS